MAWYDEAVFYHIYPLGLTGAPKENHYDAPEPRLRGLFPWIDHLREMGVTALYIGPLFQSVGHGYETTDYRTVDCRLGTNEDLKELVALCHGAGIRVIFDGVFNHVGRDFFAFKDLLEKREASPYRDWFCDVNFWNDNSYGDGFSYGTWGGYDLLVKLNQRNPAVRDYLLDVVRFWVDEFDIDGIRLDAADVLDFDFMHALRAVANGVKPDFWLMGEVIHGEYSRWVNGDTLHAVTDYSLHKALFSGHNDHNYFEIAHTVKRNLDMGGGTVDGLKLYNFVDNHDVDRIASKLDDPGHFLPVHVLLYTLPGTPSIYYGSEWAIEGKRTNYADDMLRPCIHLADHADAGETCPSYGLVCDLGRIRRETPALSYGQYRELALTNRQYAFGRIMGDEVAIVACNNDGAPASVDVDALGHDRYQGALGGAVVEAQDGRLHLELPGDSAEIYRPVVDGAEDDDPEAAERARARREAMEAQRKAAQEAREAELAQKREAEEALLRQAQEAMAAVVAEAAAEVDEKDDGAADGASAASADADAAGNAASADAAGGAASSADAAGADAADVADEAGTTGADADGAVDADAAGNAANADATDVADEAGTTGADAADKPRPELDPDFLLGRTVPFEEMTVPQLQLSILAQMAMRGPVTEQMRKDVAENVYHDSLVNWAKSFN